MTQNSNHKPKQLRLGGAEVATRQAQLVELLRAHPKMSYNDIRDTMGAQYGTFVSAAFIARAKRELGLIGEPRRLSKPRRSPKKEPTPAPKQPTQPTQQLEIVKTDALEQMLVQLHGHMRTNRIARITVDAAGTVNIERSDTFKIV